MLFEGPLSPFDWGTAWTKKDHNAHCLRRVEKLIDRYLPETLVLESFERRNSNRSDRIERLGRALVSLALDRGLSVAVYTKRQVQSVFSTIGAVSRQEIAETIARHIDAFRHRLPARRKPWQSDDERMGLFGAAALALTHYLLDAELQLPELP